MLDIVLLTAALALGQPGTDPVAAPRKAPAPHPTLALDEGPAARPVLSLDEERALLAPLDPLASSRAAVADEPPPPAPIEINAPLMPLPATPAAPPAPAAAATPADRWMLMRGLQGTWLGLALDENRMQVYGWMDGSFTASTASHSNQPVVWNDQANDAMFEQFWLRFDRALVTSGTQPSLGFRSDWLIGSDYRFSLPRGLWNGQLLAADLPFNDPARQNLYGVDPIQFYGSAYVPTLFQGTEFRFGRHFCPWGAESLEAVSTPLMSRSYAFNWSPPFTHCGFMMLSNLSPQWNVNLMAVNGNDVMFGDPAAEWRFVGKLTWTSPTKRDIVAVATSVGRGKFNTGEPFAPNIISLADEPAGRNNLNAFDVYWTHVINSRLTYQLETIYGYQTGVPTVNAFGGVATIGAMIDNSRLSGTAHWGSVCQYLIYTITPQLGSIVRFELFDDFEGQRTGYEGLYTAITGGLQFRPYKSVIIRPELRYDYNGYNKPFNPDSTNTGRDHGLFTAGTDVIVRW